MNRREEILAAAGRLVVTDGVHALSVRAVAREAGVGASTLRHYFRTQDELYGALVRGFMADAVDDQRIRDRSIAPAERLTECLAQFLPSGAAPAAQLRGWFDAYAGALAPGSADPASAEVLAHTHAAGLDFVRRWLTALAEEGHGDPSRIDETATALLALLDGLALHLLADPGRMSLDTARQTLRWAVDAALRSPA